ncbi:MAG TPA: TonB-dependent receptor, partial [Gemmatimonadales bacterium]|nr:TonB-dependent receptor [Gemmatimonadales bacterium]
AVTDARGRYAIPLLPPGLYTVRVRQLGYRPAALPGVRVTVGEATPVDVTLEAAPVALEEVRVEAEATRIDPTRTGVAQTIAPDLIENLPVLGRDFTDFLALSPLISPQPQVGTGGQFSVGGARTSGTNLRVDGADANNVFFGENRGSSRTPFTFSLESVKEFQLVTNGYDVEYGNYQGGVVNAVTRGGTNQLRASGFLYFRDEGITGKDFTGQDPTDFRVYQFGFSVSGPIRRDKLHFFLSLDGQQQDQPIFAGGPEAATGVSADSLQRFLTILRTVHGLQNPERFFGRHTQEEDNLVAFARLDWTISDRHRLTLRQNYSDFEQTNDRISTEEAITHGGPFQDQVWSTVAELNSLLGASAFNTARVQVSYEDRPRPYNPDGGFLPEIQVDRMGSSASQIIEFGGDGIVFRNRLEERKLEFIDNFTYRRGDHTVKLGTSDILSQTTNTFWLLGNGEYRFLSLTDFANNAPTSYFRLLRPCPVPLVANAAAQPVICPQYDVPFAEFQALEWNVYLQDEWQATDRLLVTAGVRYGGTSFPDKPGLVQAVLDTFGIRTDVVPSFTGVSPRVSFTYDPRGDRRTVLRGGVGLLVGRAPTVLAGNVFQTERPLLSVFCTGANVPAFNLQELLADPTGQNNPAACAGGAAPTGRPEHSAFAPDFALPRTLKASLGVERLLGQKTRVALDLIYSASRDQFNVVDLNLRDPVFTTGVENRPVFVPAAGWNPRNAAGAARLRSPAFDRIFLNVNQSEARAWNVALEVDHRLSDAVQIAGRYAFNRAYDNSSFSCCTSGEGFSGETTAGDPNFIGDPGDDRTGAWGPSRFERRHVFVANLLYRAPFGLRVSALWRLQSGTPWTPVVNGDVNGDGVLFNDRAYVGTNLEFASAADRARMDSLIQKHECLRDQVGRIAARNSCRNPWFNSLDLRLSYDLPTVRGQRVEVLLDLFNVLNGLNERWGRFMGVFGSRQNLLNAQSYNAATGNVVYSVPATFGEEQPMGFDPFQYQMQLGVRYRF